MVFEAFEEIYKKARILLVEDASFQLNSLHEVLSVSYPHIVDRIGVTKLPGRMRKYLIF